MQAARWPRTSISSPVRHTGRVCHTLPRFPARPRRSNGSRAHRREGARALIDNDAATARLEAQPPEVRQAEREGNQSPFRQLQQQQAPPLHDQPDNFSSGSPGPDTGSPESSQPSSVLQQAPAPPDTQQDSGGPQPQADSRKLQADLEEEQRRLTPSPPPPQQQPALPQTKDSGGPEQQADRRKLQADLEEEQRRLTQSLPPPQQQSAPPQTNGKKPASPEEEQKQQRKRKKSRIQELEEIRIDLARRQASLLEKERDLLDKDQTVSTLQEELDLERKLRGLLTKEKEKAEEEAALAKGLCTGGFTTP